MKKTIKNEFKFELFPQGIPGANNQQLFIAGGAVDGGESFLGDVEVVDLSDGPQRPCYKPVNLPQPLYRWDGIQIITRITFRIKNISRNQP